MKISNGASRTIRLHSIPKSPMRLKSPGAPLKFPLLSRNYVIEESECSSQDNGQNMQTVKARSPLEVFQFPEPPREPPEHYSVKTSNGSMEEYAQPIPFLKEQKKSVTKNENLVPQFVPETKRDTVPNFVPETENLVPKLRRPRNAASLTMKEIEDANYNPFSQNYAILSSIL